MLEIRAPQYFHVPGHLASRLPEPYQDPRRDDFVEDRVVIDLSDCVVVNLPAALWCIVYAALIRDKTILCQVKAPTDSALCTSLAASGFFTTLTSSGVELLGDFESVEATAPSVILPIHNLADARESEIVGYEIQDRLQEAKSISTNIPSLVTEIFLELINNALEHSHSSVGKFATVQTRGGSAVLCAVADGGIGITASLSQNPAISLLHEDQKAILLALEEGITGTKSPTRGIGLNWVSHASRLMIYSGNGLFESGSQPSSRGVTFPGTLAMSTLGDR